MKKTRAHHQRDFVDRRRNAGMCVRCNQPNDEQAKKKICSSCSLADAMRKQERKDAGLCLWGECQNDALPRLTVCQIHHQKKSDYHRSLKQKILDHYGQVCNCECGCRATKFSWLTIDHRNNDGAVLRKGKKHPTGSAFYGWIIKNNFPDDLQVLCWNCNCAKAYFGECI